MARSAKALVKPALLVWARESIGLSIEDVARRVPTKPEKVTAWEAGEDQPSVVQLRKLAAIYKRPLAVFYLAEPPKDFAALRDFRRLPDESQRRWSPGLRVELRRAQEQRESALELVDLTGEEVEQAWSTLADLPRDADEVAAAARSVLGVTRDEQRSWRDQYQALAGWVDAVEATGVLVLQTSNVPMREMRGFSISTETFPVIVINAGDAVRGRIFTVLHEFAHLLLRAGGLCDLHNRTETAGDLEPFCNAIAASILMPPGDFLAERVVAQAPAGFTGWDSSTLRSLAADYTTSEEAVLRRLLTFGKTTEEFYRSRRAELQEQYRRQQEERRDSTGFAPYHLVRVRDLGRGYVRLAFDAYDRDAINVSDLSSFLGVKVRHLTAMRDELARRGA